MAMLLRQKKARSACLLGAALTAALILGALAPAGGQKQSGSADEQAIRAASADFARAFAQGDAHAVAAFWTEQGECHQASGEMLVGRDAIEKAFAVFLKEHPQVKVDVLIASIRFPAPDLALEEGVLRFSGASKELPSSTLYSVTHVRQSGAWKMAVSREWGAGQDRLEDLDWLIGRWQASVGGEEVTMSFAHAAGKPFLTGEFTKKATGKVVAAGTFRIGFDPRRGQLRSWHFDEEGGHGDAFWVRDGARWLLNSTGALADGTETAAVNILGRLGPDEFTWRSIERVLGDQELPDTTPIKLRRVAAGR